MAPADAPMTVNGLLTRGILAVGTLAQTTQSQTSENRWPRQDEWQIQAL
jgi:hypothetical protein